MFTGIIEELGTVERVTRGRVSAILAIRAEAILSDLKIGDSVAVNGVCLTATSLTGHGFTADVMHETLDRSALAGLGPGSPVNLERAMAANGRFGGHIVAGHVDGVGTIAAIEKDDNAIWFTITAPAQVLRYVVEKGSIAIDGISLTVARVETDRFAVSVIPHTAAVTLLGQRRTGDRVNLESDLVGKYVERLLRPAPEEKQQESKLTMEFLSQHGF